MSESLQVAIKNIQLFNTTFNIIPSVEVDERSLVIDIPNDSIINEDNDVHFEVTAKFEIKIDDIFASGFSKASLVLVDFNKESALEFITNKKIQLAYPVISKVCALISKVSEDMRTIPIVISPEEWIEYVESIENEEE